MQQNTAPVLWVPDAQTIEKAHLSHYMKWLKTNRGLEFNNYSSLWTWSTEAVDDFWESLWEYFKIISHTPYTSIRSGETMPDVEWFSGSTLNYAEHVFREKNVDNPAIIFKNERNNIQEISWQELEEKVAAFQFFLLDKGVQKGDRIVAFLPNIPEATIAFLATISIGAVWSSCSPDFGVSSVVDRFQQIEPKVLVAVDGYTYGGKSFSRLAEVAELCEALPTVENVVLIPYLEDKIDGANISKMTSWVDALQKSSGTLHFEAVPFSHPIWVLYSSGTTGIPKAITHCHGGVLLEHLKYLAFHNDVHRGERFFWFSTTGWMMWNFVNASLLMGATVVLYDGSPAYPDLRGLWNLAKKVGIHHFGTSAPFIVACMKKGLNPRQDFDLSALRSIGSTGSPLPPEAFDYVYKNIKETVWLCSMSGGTDVCSAFVGGCSILPVYQGEIQCRGLGCSLHAYDEAGKPTIGEMGEMVIVEPMPSMPIYFWNDKGKQRYRSSYFEMYPNIWRHGDWIEITPRDGLIIYGRSDATLNRQGIRIGTSEIYSAVDKVKAVKDSLVVNLELEGGQHFMPLFVVLGEGIELEDDLRKTIKTTIRKTYTPRHVPDEIIEVDEIPYTISGKKMERPVKRILLGHPLEKAANIDSMKNPKALDFFIQYKETL